MASKRKDVIRSAAWIVATGLLGAVIALLLARTLILSSANSRLAAYSAEIIHQDETLASNITETLAAANASPDPLCSAADLARLRALLFRSPFLKDVGRVDGDGFRCSAMAGALPAPVRMATPDLVTFSGKKIYYDYPLETPRGYRAQIVAHHGADVVVSPDVFTNMNRAPMSFAGWVVNRTSGTRLRTYSNFPGGRAPEGLASGKSIQQDGYLYHSLCSQTRPDCVVTGETLASIWAPSGGDFIRAAIVGALVGGGFSAALLFVGRRRRSLVAQLRRAIKRGELALVYQPIVDLADGEIVGAEALVRWPVSDGAAIPPDIFIALAEENGLIRDLTKWVLDRAATDLRELLRGNEAFRVTINLSVYDLLDKGFPAHVRRLLIARSIPSSAIGFELTERSTAERGDIIEAIRQLRAGGHLVYIDDFGTGYSSLSYLHELAVDLIKVDRSFTANIGTTSVTASIVPQILAMAENLKLKVVVEGIEHAGQVDYLLATGSPLLGQGWLFGRPIPVADLRRRLAAIAPIWPPVSGRRMDKHPAPAAVANSDEAPLSRAS